MSVGAGSIKRAAAKTKTTAETAKIDAVETKSNKAQVKKHKTETNGKSMVEVAESTASDSFCHLTEDLPVHLL